RRFDELKRITIPIITVDVPLMIERSVCVGCDQVKGAYLATRHLIEMGHRSIGMINGHSFAPVSHERFTGFQHALQEAGIPLNPLWIKEGDYSRQSGARCMQELLTLDSRPTALFCASDLMALGAMETLRAQGLSIPDDMSLVGVDNIRAAADAYPPLTTVHQPRYLIGKAVADATIEAIRGDAHRRGASRVFFDPELVVRDSVARIA